MRTNTNDYEQCIYDWALDSAVCGHHGIAALFLTELNTIDADARDECWSACAEIYANCPLNSGA